MGPVALEVADIFRIHGPAWRLAQRSHLSPGQLKVMSAIEQCRTAALGGHVLRCDACDHEEISYNSCRNWHCPKCQARAAQRWLEARQADLLPVEYYHVVFTLPEPISAIAYTNKAVSCISRPLNSSCGPRPPFSLGTLPVTFWSFGSTLDRGSSPATYLTAMMSTCASCTYPTSISSHPTAKT